MNIIITSGGTSENIDAVRAITNSSTGRLGSAIAEKLAAADVVSRIFYVHGARAARPEHDKITHVPAHDTAALEAELLRIAASHEISAIVHAMAVSDYRVARVTNEKFEELDRTKKISSSEPSLVLFMEKTPKIISLLRGLTPNACIVGFKLLNGVPESELLEAARGVLTKNDCDFVLANDSRLITPAEHHAILLKRGGEITGRFATKAEIADGIADAVLGNAAERAKR